MKKETWLKGLMVLSLALGIFFGTGFTKFSKAEAASNYLELNYSVNLYDGPSTSTRKAGSIAPQTITVLQEWHVISTSLGAKWVGFNGFSSGFDNAVPSSNTMYISGTLPLRSSPSDGTPDGYVANQNVKVIQTWYLISTSLGAKWIYFNADPTNYPKINFTFHAGDILVTDDTTHYGFESLPGHAAIVLPDGQNVVEIKGQNYTPSVEPIVKWFSENHNKVQVVRYNSTSPTLGNNASYYAFGYWVAGKGRFTPYSITHDPRDLTKTYCSEIVWSSYYYGANFNYKINNYLGGPFATPVYIVPYDYVNSIFQKYNGFKTAAVFGW